jgi:hypothetical protein
MTDQAPNNFVVVINSIKELEYFRDRDLNDKQVSDLEIIDAKMDEGFEVGGQEISHPTHQDKATYAANVLISALMNDSETTAAIFCSYLATRNPALKQLKATTHDDRVTIQLIYDKEYKEETSVQFISKKDLY